jgi:hypothetical protein
MLANIIRNRKKTGIGGGGGGIVIDGGDPYYSAVSLMLSMDGTNGSTTFTDSSLNAISVTATGNAQISTTQSKFGGASAYFDGTGDYLDIPYGNSLNITTDYTIEFWMRADSVTGYAPIFTITSATTSFFGGIYVVRNGSTITFETRPADGSGSATIAVTGGSISANTWYHVAASVSSNSARLFINGVQVGSTTTFTSRTFTPTGVRVGRFANNFTSGLVDFQGYIDDLRISRFARYVSNFAPPTAALPTTASSTVADPYYNYTSLLLHMDGTNGSTNFVDSGPNALAVTAAGNAQISTAQNKYGGASGHFDGFGDYLSMASNPLFNFGTGDFTIELWVNLPNNNVDYSLVAGSANGNMDFRRESTGQLSLGRAAVAWDANSSVMNIANQWTHLAASRSGSTLRLFCNGIQIYSGSNSVSYSVANLQIGRTTGVSAVDLNGYIDDLRITKYARYTSAFTPPAAALPEFATGNDRYFSNVSLLLHMDGANGSTTFTDNSSNSYAITKYGTAAVSTTQSQFGGSSGYFDGSGARLGLSSTAIDFGTGDFTAECWIYLNASPVTTGQIMGKHVYGSSASWLFQINSSRILSFLWNNGVNILSTGTALSLSQWQHIAVSRSGSTIRIFVDGTQVASSAISYTFASSTEFTVGSSANDNVNARLNAYIDDIRLTKTARYTANFTPPTSAHPNA